LHGVEQELINRCATDELAQRFSRSDADICGARRAVHSGFEMNPSPGNIADGLTTDAIKSAGAARKGGVSPIQRRDRLIRSTPPRAASPCNARRATTWRA
jgi:altronate hydrolase